LSGKNLLICDAELSYVNLLMENILSGKELLTDVRACTSWESLEKHLTEVSVDILLIAEEWEERVKELNDIGKVYFLTSQKEKKGKYIYKYQNANEIIATIFEDEKIFLIKEEQKIKTLAVYSPIHRVGKTKYAIKIGKQHARKEKTLYLNLEEYAGLEGACEEGRGTLADLLYYLEQETENIWLKLKAMVLQDGWLDYLLPMPNCKDLKEVRYEQWRELLAVLAETGYETIVLDLGESVQGLWDILRLCDRVYMPILEDDISLGKIEKFEKNLIETGYGDVLKKVYKFSAKEES